MRASVLDTLDDFGRWGSECAYVHPRGYRHERWSYRNVTDTAYRFARELQSRGVNRGDAVLLWAANSAEWVAAFVGCALCGVVVVPLDDTASPDFVQRVAAQTEPKLILCPPERASLFADVPAFDLHELSSVLAQHSPAPFRPVAIQPSDPLEIVFTSGTTAEPKGVVISHANIVANIAPLETEIAKYLKYEKLVHPIRFLNLLPLSHVFGQFLGIFLPPLMGGTVVFESTLNPAHVIDTIRRERVSVLVAVPRMIDSLKQKIERDSSERGHVEQFEKLYRAAEGQQFLHRWWTFRDIHRQFGWKFWAMISGGAALDPETEQFWRRIGYAVVQGYGLTETTSLISVNHPFRMSQGSIGKILPGREIKLADDGEILVRGGGVATGYWSGQEMQPVAGEEGWFHTGDLGALDEGGNLFFKGRKKEVIVTPAGMNVYPADLEAALRAQPEIKDCVVIGLHRGGNAEPCAVLILRDSTDAASIVGRANQALSEYQRIREWFVWPEPDFPRTSTQKPRRSLIRHAVQVALSQGADDGNGVAEIASPLSELVARVSPRTSRHITPESSLDDALALTSLERVELLGAIEDRYQIDLSETSFAAANTVGDLEKLLRGEVRAYREFHYPRWALRWPITWIRAVAHYLLVRPAVFLLGAPRVLGRENLRGVHGPLLVISNHIDDVDVGFIQTALPLQLRYRLATAAGGEALEILRSPGEDRALLMRFYDRMQWTLGVALLNLFPLPRESGFRKSFAFAGEAVDRGYSILVFPEGHHTEDGKLRPFRTGIGLLVNNLRIPVLPMRIDGLFAVKRSGRKFARSGEITVRIGKLLSVSPGVAPEQVAHDLQEAIQRL